MLSPKATTQFTFILGTCRFNEELRELTKYQKRRENNDERKEGRKKGMKEGRKGRKEMGGQKEGGRKGRKKHIKLYLVKNLKNISIKIMKHICPYLLQLFNKI